jgi:F-type H+-transporting ATPase subunit epsilon
VSQGNVTLETAGDAYTFYDEKTDAAAEGTGTRTLTFTIDQGFVEVLNNEVNLLVQGARNVR